MTGAGKTSALTVEFDRAAEMRALSAERPKLAILCPNQHGRVMCAWITEIKKRTGQDSLSPFDFYRRISEFVVLPGFGLALKLFGGQRKSSRRQQQAIAESSPGKVW
jgi:hypothetical protein